MIKVLYINYENLFKTAILQGMVVKPLDIMSKKYDIDFTVTSAYKNFEKDKIYHLNKNYVESNTDINVIEFEKKLTSKQSIFTFIKDIIPILSFSIKRAKEVDIIHCRSYGGAVIGYIASKFSGKPFIFDMRGTLPEETVDVGKIKKNSLKFKIMKFAEKFLIKNANYVFTVSNKFNEYVKNNFKKKNVININNPTDFSVYKPSKKNKDKISFIYSGSLQKWHVPELVIQYFDRVQKKYGDKVFLNFCTNDLNEAKKIFKKYNVDRSSYVIKNVPYYEIGREYSNSDIGFCLIKESFSKSVCFPVKFSEYIASNIFVIGNENIGDIPEIITKYKCGIVLDNIYNIEKNINSIYDLVDKMLNEKLISYDRNQLKFLDWNSEGVKNIMNIYYKLIKK